MKHEILQLKYLMESKSDFKCKDDEIESLKR